MQPLEPKLIIVPTDFSAPAAHAIRYAGALGERFGAHLLVVYADSFIPAVDFTASAAGSFTAARDMMIEEAREQLESHAEVNIGANVPYDVRVILGEPVAAIAQLARETGANLIVMGTHGRSGVARMLFGSVTEAVMRISPAPVIAVNQSTSETATVNRVLCPVTFTDASRAALRQAVALADGQDAPILLLHGLEATELQPSIDELIRLQDWAPSELAGRYELRTVPNRAPAEKILDLALATATDLIAMEVASDESFTNGLHATLAERIVRESRCPVLAVNPIAARHLSRAKEFSLSA